MYLSWIELVNGDVVSALTSLVALIGSYFILRERVVKIEIKNQHVVDYVDNQVNILKTEIINIKEDISDFKELNKENTKSLSENTTAIRELKLVLELLRDQINKNQI